MIVQGLIFQGEVLTVPVESHHAPTDEAASTGVDVIHGEAATTVTSLNARQGSGNIDKTLYMPHDSPLPRVNTLGSDEGSMTLKELTVLCTTLSQKVESLEEDLKQTKQVYGAAYTKLIIKVKRLEKTVKTGKARRKVQIIVFDDEEEFADPSKQGRTKILADTSRSNVQTYTRRRAVSTGSGGVSTASRMISTAGASMPTWSRDSCETARAFNEEERKRIAKFHKAAQTFTEEECQNIRARVEDDEELTQRLQAEERDKYSEVDQAKMLVDLINQRK
uniref:Uncharacterized protein n=1 Tax=Tanacetum cinerariifolium TaxID=118510 RepID=A0A6L2KCJ1_TANCI|nr:hypothetical protein [Tanacetum cinerariifolium]